MESTVSNMLETYSGNLVGWNLALYLLSSMLDIFQILVQTYYKVI